MNKNLMFKKILMILTMSIVVFSDATWSEKSVPKETSSEKREPIKLESNFIGDKEQPLVSYFIPWKEIGTPDKLQWELDSKYDKTLVLVDRKVMLRLSGMYQTMKLEQNLPKQDILRQHVLKSDLPKSDLTKPNLQKTDEAK